jgi:hypothetical protein
LTFRNAAVDAGVAAAPLAYAVAWRSLDATTGRSMAFGVTEASVPRMAAPEAVLSTAHSHVGISVTAAGGPESWSAPAHAVFRRDPHGWTLVGFQRVPTGNPPARTEAPATNAARARSSGGPSRIGGAAGLPE